MAESLPNVDARRASKLREELVRNARMLTPEWAGVAQDGDFGRALLEIAARLAEHSTSRLDATPLRDKLAFLDALDVATPAPQSATAPIVFTLAERRDTKVSAPARVQLTADVGDDEVTFETRAAIDITPARIGNLVMTDPATDWIERAPPYVTRSVDQIDPPTGYRLLSAVEANASTIQLVQGVGIEPGDLLRLTGGVYRVEKVKDGIVQLLDKLTQPAPAGAPVVKLIALESFALRNLQQHDVYFGHKEMLKLDGPAAITLVFDPPTLPALLAGLDVKYEIWGTSDDEKNEEDRKPGWRPLELLGAGPAGLVLGKSWNGSVDEFELAAGKSRWVRIRLNTPIEGACGPPTGTTSVEIKVRSSKPDEADGEGSKTIGAAFYNSQPLPTSTAFLPFGPEPQRFDIFSLSAPEALSKKGATVTLKFNFDDATLGALAYDPIAPNSVYGVSVNGRLQSVRLSLAKGGDWRSLGLAPIERDERDDSGRLNPAASLYVLHVSDQLELVFAQGKDGILRAAKVTIVGEHRTVSEWTNLPHPNGGTFSAFCLIHDPARNVVATGVSLSPISAPARPLAYLFVAGEDGFYSRAIGGGGTLHVGWQKLHSDSNKPLGTIGVLAVAERALDVAVIVGIDTDGAAYSGIADLVGRKISWNDFTLKDKASSAIPPVAFLDDGAPVLIAASQAENLADRKLILAGGSARPDQGAIDRVGAPQSITSLPIHGNDSAPLLVVVGDKGILIWTGEIAENAALPADTEPATLRALLLPGAESPKLLLAADNERALISKVSAGRTEVSVELLDWLHRDHGSTIPTHALVNSDASRAIHKLDGDWIDNGTTLVRPAPHNDGKNYVLLVSLAKDLSGRRVSDRTLALDPNGVQASKDDVLEIGGDSFKVASNATAGAVDVDADLPGATDLTYQLFRPTDSKTNFVKADRKRFARLVSPQLTAPLKFLFASPAAPRNQDVVAQFDEWLLLKKVWTKAPAASTAQAQLLDVPSIELEEQIRLPREADNPELSWEYFNGNGWQRLEQWELIDRTGNFARSGTVRFTVPNALTATEIAGTEDYWLRVRLIGGDYGRPSYDIVSAPPIPPTPPATAIISKTSISIDRSRLNPPEIISIEASYVLDKAATPDFVVADNNLAAINQTQAALTDGALFNLFEGVAQHVGDNGAGTRALYLGLTKRPDVQALGLYADILDQGHDRRDLVAEVLTAGGWKRIGVDDDTAGLVRPGMIRPILVPPPEQLPLFGQDGWWLRFWPKEAAADWAPIVRGLFVNAVMAAHATTVSDELLGSSLGEPKQRYLLAQRPVLPDTLELRVLESLGQEERKAIETALGKNAVRDDAQRRGQWVQWREVPTFVDEDGDARVFRLDPASGEVAFGNGTCGKIPPAGTDSIRASSYQWGGGSTGNVPARAIANLSSAIESVELAMNPAEAAGGADAPAAERLAIVTPDLLRHAGKALAPVDIEAIATGSAPDVVRARCLPRRGCTIELVVAIRDTGQRCPEPSRERREGIARNILAAGWGPLAPETVTVRAPRYVPARVDAEVIAENAEAVAGVEQQIRVRLAQFLHPVEGGPDGLGWPFGRRIWPSDLQRAIASVAGLDRIVGVSIKGKTEGEDLAMPLDGLVCVEDADLNVFVRSPEDGR